jgi:hypothetical protein
LIIIGLPFAAEAHDVITPKITWTREVSRLVYKNCVSCHRDGGPAFSLVNYAEARPWAKAIKEEVFARRMPPWNAVKGFGEFAGDKGLTQEQIEVIADWVEGGAPEGDPAYLPKTPRGNDASAPVLNGKRIAVAGAKTIRAAVKVAGIQPRSIEPGGALLVVAKKPDGSVEPMLWVQEFNPAFQDPYRYRSPVALPAGTVVETSPATGQVTLFLDDSR